MSGDDELMARILLRYDVLCNGCERVMPRGVEVYFDSPTKLVRCLDCGPVDPSIRPEPVPERTLDLLCEDCNRRYTVPLKDADGATTCPDCTNLNTRHVTGVPGIRTRQDYERRVKRHVEDVREGRLKDPKSLHPDSLRALQRSVVGEEQFGIQLTEVASGRLKVLYDCRVPEFVDNLDAVAVVSRGVWVIETHRISGPVEVSTQGTRRRPKDVLIVNGRDRKDLVSDALDRARRVSKALAPVASRLGLKELRVKAAIAFVGDEVRQLYYRGIVDDVWISRPAQLIEWLDRQRYGNLDVDRTAKLAARALKPSRHKT